MAKPSAQIPLFDVDLLTAHEHLTFAHQALRDDYAQAHANLARVTAEREALKTQVAHLSAQV